MKKRLLIAVGVVIIVLFFCIACWKEAQPNPKHPATIHDLASVLIFAEQKDGDYAADVLDYLITNYWTKEDLHERWGTPYSGSLDGLKDTWHLSDKHELTITYNTDPDKEVVLIEIRSEQTQPLPGEYDMNHNGTPEHFTLTHNPCSDEYTLSLLEADREIWCGYANTSHAGWNSLFAVKHNGQDYLLQYVPSMSTGCAFYSYQLFSLDENGNELLLQSDEVEFGVNFGGAHQSFDPKRIADFLEEVHALLNDSQLLLSTENFEFLTGGNGADFKADQFWLNESLYDPEKSLEENLRIYAEYLTELRKYW